MNVDLDAYQRWVADGLTKPGKKANKLADVLGITPPQVTRIVQGIRKVKAHEIAKIAVYLGSPPPISQNEIFDPTKTPDRDGDITRAPLDEEVAGPQDLPANAIKELASRGGSGNGDLIQTTYVRHGEEIQVTDAFKPDPWILPSAFIREAFGVPATSLMVVETRGDSMCPTIETRSRVFIDTTHRRISPDGIYAIRDDYDEIVVKRLQRLGDKILIISDNPLHHARTVSLDEIFVVGKVVAVIKLL